MVFADVLTLLVNSLTWAMATFLVAAGLTLIFGTLHILNFSHGGFFMIGAYAAYSLTQSLGGSESMAMYLFGALVGGVVVAALGLAVDRLILRRLSGVDDAYVLIATYALLLVCEGGTKLIWGLNYRSVMPPTVLDGAWLAGQAVIPKMSAFIVACGIAVFVAMEFFLNRTRPGRLVKAIAADPWMARLLGVNVRLVYTATVAIGFALAGLAGGLLLANQTLSPSLASGFVIQAFGVIIIGGMGSISGAFLGSILLGLIDAVGQWVLPSLPGLPFFIAMTLILLLRPQGLMGRRH
ncbi:MULTISPECIES: branched-chain amino acid ABC transporter permease [unclassified Acidovorax]|uniref:branched-chain amino acid ABC transporter permease n=1 Tax=unclassified Acidovorax TaxID=2684926 RepID=UPI0006FB9881|nr:MULTISPECIES: branched-chain amino acid ABC transporter permease [unclassified Acidovorax]KRB27008.1 amino acid ABC transporter permease [Acidovorax sp. Root70]PUA98776.1 amino acid/amide ABC transporter membrane protein 1 (HAAT family) [Acidovorax sp. 107]